MRKFDARAFYKVTTAMQRTLALIESKRSVQENPDGGVTIEFIADGLFIGVMLDRAHELQRSLLELGAKLTSMQADRLLQELSSGNTTYESLTRAYREIDSRLADELSLKSLFVVDSEKRSYFEPSEPLFGLDVQTKFPSAEYEIEEAAKCFALGRSTAAVLVTSTLRAVAASPISFAVFSASPMS